MELPKAYNPKDYEDKIYSRWEKSGFFNPDKLPGERPDPYCIVMPPPNRTGVLHIGHAVMLAVEDIMIRFARMRGKKALWIPGTDHAAIATQTKVEKLLWEKEGIRRQELGREKFLARVKAFAAESHDTIIRQVRKMGASCDWSREAYTLDEKRSAAVAEAFKRLHDLGLLYRGERVVNWCPRCGSTLADDEVEYQEGKTTLYTFRYDKKFPIAVSTTRPETKLGDTAVAVHPDDARYAQFLGQEFSASFVGLPLKLRIVSDPAVDAVFGTGALGVTPAHSKEDERIAAANNLPSIRVIDEDGMMTDQAGEFVGMSALSARQAIVRALRQAGLVDKEEEVAQNLSVCYRCGTTIEPLPKLQWWLSVNKPFAFRQSARSPIEDVGDGEKITLKELMIHVVKSGQIQIIPDRFVKAYYHWIENLRDWNISRQIWFGHQVPVWYHDTCQAFDEKGQSMYFRPAFVGGISKGKGNLYWCPNCNNGYKSLEHFHQDEDTLDTWFSSGLWTFSTLGWPEQTKDFLTYHPTAVLETGYDILFFWIARMILMSVALTGEIPFRTVYLHGLVRDEQGRKMSKSLGNIIDPLDVAEKYGTDAVRLSLVLGTTPGNDTRLSEEKIAGFRNFTNKLWNIGRYVIGTTDYRPATTAPKPKTLPDRWVLSRLAVITQEVTRHLESHEFSVAGELLRDFTWGDFADWYLEIVKVQKQRSAAISKNTDAILRYVFVVLLRLWHPFMPFVTEVLWRELSGSKAKMLLVEDWPVVSAELEDGVAFANMKWAKDIVTAIRDIRANYKISPKITTEVLLLTPPQFVSDELDWMGRLSSSTITIGTKMIGENWVRATLGQCEVFVRVAGQAGVAPERIRLSREAENLERYLAVLDARLKNAEFVDKAPRAVVEKEKEKRLLAAAKLAKICEELER